MIISDSLLQKARLAQFTPSSVRLVLDVQNIHNYRIFSLSNPFRIVVDVTGKSVEATQEKIHEPGNRVESETERAEVGSISETPPEKPVQEKTAHDKVASEKAAVEKTTPEKGNTDKGTKNQPNLAVHAEAASAKTPGTEKQAAVSDSTKEKKNNAKTNSAAEKTGRTSAGSESKPETQAEVKPEPKATVSKAETKTKPNQPLAGLRGTALKRKQLPRGPAGEQINQESLARQLGLGVRKVIIDPGHGGRDVGATGVTGLREKDFTLEFSRLLAARIKERLGLTV
ncbi:MAG: N-acetylmuramoyl-L-alanine amidase, partial [Deltaproteobacteria bacterium]|nr:N-acetylmuramoyl-L-alanine amidase [Deltaproteobacteria bacterium]